MDLGLDDAVVLITGGSRGIGLACALAFASEGARIAIASREAAHLAQAMARLDAMGARSIAVQADLTDPDQARRMVRETEEAIGPVDVLVNSAGAARRTPPDELTPGHWHAAMQAKYFTYVHAMDAVLVGMALRGHGAIVNVIGMGGKLASPTHLPGGAANAALMLATAGLGNAYAPHGVRINAVNPGLTATTRLHEGFEAEARLAETTPEEIERRRTQAMPMRRIAEPREIADVVLFLASARASYVNGAVLSLDGAATPTVV